MAFYFPHLTPFTQRFRMSPTKKGDINYKEYENDLHALRKELKQSDIDSLSCIKLLF
jgi:hypothetical protein